MRKGLAVVTLSLLAAATAQADGERTPMIGGSVVWQPTVEAPSGIGGFEVEAAWWHSWIGIALEGAGRTNFDTERRGLGVGGSLRLLVLNGLQRSLLEPRDVEVGLELQGIVERMWWQNAATDPEPYNYGFGFALRVRGGSDRRVATHRRVALLHSLHDRPRHEGAEVIARSTMPVVQQPRDLMILFGIGASWGNADRRYLDRFAWHQPEWR